MNRVFILRHAKAGQHVTNDHDRPLTDVGRQQAHILGAWLAEQGIDFDAALCSSSLRTVETVENLGLSLSYRIVPQLYSASARAIESVIQQSPVDAGTILIVAHNPGVTDLVESVGKHDVMGTCEIVELLSELDFASFGSSECRIGRTFRPQP